MKKLLIKLKLFFSYRISFANLPQKLKNKVEYITSHENRDLKNIIFKRANWGSFIMYELDQDTYYNLYIKELEID